MTEGDSVLATIYTGWADYQGHLTKAIAPLSPDQLALRAAPDLRSIGTLAAHIISARIWWFHHALGEGSADLAPMVDWDEDDAPARTADELVGALETSWLLIQDALARWSPADLAQTFQHRDHIFPRQWVIWHLIEHDIHHGGELCFTMGMHGLEAPDL